MALAVTVCILVPAVSYAVDREYSTISLLLLERSSLKPTLSVYT